MKKDELEKAFESNINEHTGLILKVCRMYAFSNADRQDLYQEIVIQLWKAFPNFKGHSRFSTWLYRVAINTAITGLRSRKDFISYYEPSQMPVNVAEDPGEGEEMSRQLKSAVDQLNEIEKAIVMLYMEDRSYDEMEEILGISQGNLRVKMSRIKEKLRQLTKKY